MEFVARNHVINNLHYFTTGWKADLNSDVKEYKIMFHNLILNGIYNKYEGRGVAPKL